MSTKPPVAVPMRCARTGKRFFAAYKWNKLRSRYVLQELALAESVPNSAVALGSECTCTEPEFDNTGFACPLCGHSVDTNVAVSFVKCGKCNELVCGGRIHKGDECDDDDE